jgi:succinate dehydrogenase / fumarate reductase cytochrome b subunit
MRDMRDALQPGRNSQGRLVNRPLSPFMIPKDYRPQLTSVLSISNRITGVALCAGVLLAAWWLLALAAGDAAFALVRQVTVSPVGLALLFGWTLALIYHTLGGLRHLMWDAGHGFDLPTVHRTGWAVVALSLGLTAALWAFAIWLLG